MLCPKSALNFLKNRANHYRPSTQTKEGVQFDHAEFASIVETALTELAKVGIK